MLKKKCATCHNGFTGLIVGLGESFTVGPPNNGHIGDVCFVHCSEVVPSSEGEMYGQYTGRGRTVCPLSGCPLFRVSTIRGSTVQSSECPLSEVPL